MNQISVFWKDNKEWGRGVNLAGNYAHSQMRSSHICAVCSLTSPCKQVIKCKVISRASRYPFVYVSSGRMFVTIKTQ